MKNNRKNRAGSEVQYGPRPVGEILQDFWKKSNSPLARAYRERLFKDIHPHTELGVNLKLLTREPGRMPVGAFLYGTIVHDRESHFTFEETVLPATRRRNPRIYDGRFITVTIWPDGSLHPNFKAMKMDDGFSIGSYALGVCIELREALKGFIEEDN